MSLLVGAVSLLQATTSSGRPWPYWWVWLIIAAIFLVMLLVFRGGARPPRTP